MTPSATLLSDQVFQLNTLLWALEQVPGEAGPVDPVLRSAGYYLDSIGRRLIVPVSPNARTALRAVTGTDDLSPTNPDLWLRHASEDAVPLVELKSHGFSPDSSNSRQALKMIISAADVASAVGRREATAGHVLYATAGTDSAGMSETLKTLEETVSEVGGSPAKTGVLSLIEVDAGVGLGSPVPDDLPSAMGAALSAPAVVLRREGEDDLQPLYFIPWIPGIEDSQDSALHAEGLQQLTARLLTQAIAAVGQSTVPGVVVLKPDELLVAATFGVFSRWRDNDRDSLIRAASNVLRVALKPTGVSQMVHGDVQIDLRDSDTQEAVLQRLEHADPADPSKNLEAALNEQLTLFETAPPDAQAER